MASIEKLPNRDEELTKETETVLPKMLKRGVKELTMSIETIKQKILHFKEQRSHGFASDGNSEKLYEELVNHADQKIKTLEQKNSLLEEQHSHGFNNDKINTNDKECSVVVFDCGTGETKCLLYQYRKDKDDCEITFEEIQKFDAVTEHIEEKTGDELLKLFEEKYTEAVKVNGKPVDYCIVGATSWARKVYPHSDINIEKNRLMSKLREEGFLPKILNQKEESFYEYLSALYAFLMAQRAKMIDTNQSLSGVLASGGGSCQYTYLSDDGNNIDSVLLELGSKKGIDLFVGEVKNGKIQQEPLDAIDDWIKESKEVIKNKMKPNNVPLVDGFVICSAGQYYAASEIAKNYKDTDVKQFCNEANEVNGVTTKNMIKTAKGYIKQQKEYWTTLTAEERQKLIEQSKKLKAWAKGLANVSICCLLWESFFKDTAMLCFKRDWEIGESKVAFRNTWSSGWFLNLLRLQQLKVYKDPTLRNVICKISDLTRKQNIKCRDFRFHYPKASQYINDMSASHLSFTDEMADRLVHVAQYQAGVCVDGWIREIQKQCETLLPKKPIKLKGFEPDRIAGEDYPDGVRFKSKKSIERKLDQKLSNLLLKNSLKKDSFHEERGIMYSPTEKELMAEIRDGLRYTIVFDTDIYFEAVKKIEEYLIGEKKCSITAKNYWAYPGNTMYMGINMRFVLPVCPVCEDCGFPDGYPVELQIHTHESYETKNGASHKLYEQLRTENVKAQKKLLCEERKKFWSDVPIPKHDGESISDYRGEKKWGEEKSKFKPEKSTV